MTTKQKEFQGSGQAATLDAAVKQLETVRLATPPAMRNTYGARIEWTSEGYAWHWQPRRQAKGGK